MPFTSNEAYAHLTQSGQVDLWFVRGQPEKAYPNKPIAEAAARLLHPDLARENGTNSLVYFTTFVREDSL